MLSWRVMTQVDDDKIASCMTSWLIWRVLWHVLMHHDMLWHVLWCVYRCYDGCVMTQVDDVKIVSCMTLWLVWHVLWCVLMHHDILWCVLWHVYWCYEVFCDVFIDVMTCFDDVKKRVMHMHTQHSICKWDEGIYTGVALNLVSLCSDLVEWGSHYFGSLQISCLPWVTVTSLFQSISSKVKSKYIFGSISSLTVISGYPRKRESHWTKTSGFCWNLTWRTLTGQLTMPNRHSHRSSHGQTLPRALPRALLELTHLPPHIVAFVPHVNTLANYNTVVSEMFSDDVYNFGRALVFMEFTRRVCLAHPTIARDVMQAFFRKLAVIDARLHAQYFGIWTDLVLWQLDLWRAIKLAISPLTRRDRWHAVKSAVSPRPLACC